VTGRAALLLGLYRGTLTVFEPAAAGLLAWRKRRGKEDPERIVERRGIATLSRPEGVPLAWVHGASVGETLGLVPIVERLTQRGLAVLVTSGTRTSAELLGRRLPAGAAHQFVPLDVPRYVRRFLDHWRPDLVLLAESDIWPSTVTELARRNIPLVLVNGRMSERSFRRWQRLPDLIGALLQRFALCLAQTQADGERLTLLGAVRVEVAGNLKFDAAAPPADPRMLAQLSGLVAGRPVLVCASTHPGEEELVLAAAHAARARYPKLLTVVVPRHPRRGPEIAALAAIAGIRAELRSEGALPEPGTEVYVADTIGELGLFYRLASLVFVGGSLVPRGGQNPIEPAKLGAAILHGPHVHNFADVYAAIDRAGGARPVADGEALTQAVIELLGNGALIRDMARAAGGVVAGLGGATERTLAAIEPYLAPLLAEPR
jgi:3-deoxy-D-manno-octulosonic-acid transferase